MKTFLTISLVFILSMQAFGQRRSKTDPKDAQIDTLTKTSKELSQQLDSVSSELKKYIGLYNVIKEKVIHYNFNPDSMSVLIDSLRASSDKASIIPLDTLASKALSDSLSLLVKENQKLKIEVDSLKATIGKDKEALTTEEIERAKAITMLKQLKELLETKIITEAEFIAMKQKYLNKL